MFEAPLVSTLPLVISEIEDFLTVLTLDSFYYFCGMCQIDHLTVFKTTLTLGTRILRLDDRFDITLTLLKIMLAGGPKIQ